MVLARCDGKVDGQVDGHIFVTYLYIFDLFINIFG